MSMVLRFGSYENATQYGMDGISLLFPFTMMNTSAGDTSVDRPTITMHSLFVDVAAGIDWADDEAEMAKVLFELGAPRIIDSISPTGYLPDEIQVFVPHQGRPLDPGRLVDIQGSVIEVELPAKRIRRFDRK